MPQQASLGVGILQGIPQPQPFGTLQNMQALGQMADQEQAKVQSQRAQAELQRVMQQYANDPDEGVNELLRRGFVKESQELGKYLGEVRTAKLKERGLHLDNLHKEGTINEQMYKLEKAAIESDDPMDAIRMIAHAKDQTQLDEARALVSFKYGPKSPHLLKVIPSQWTPDFEERMAQLVIGPEKMAGIENTGLARDQAWDLAKADDTRADAQQAQTTTYQNRMATVAERNAGSNALRARQAGGSGGGATGTDGLSASDKALVQAIIKNPGLYDKLTPSVIGRIAPALDAAGFGMGKPLDQGSIQQISQSKSAISSLQDLRKVLAENEQFIGPIAGFQALNPWSGAKQAQSSIDLVRQRVGKALEGGVLRKEDEEKYKKILSTLNDTPTTAVYKVDNLIQTIENDIKIFEDELRRSGRRMGAQAQEQKQPPRPAGVPESAVWVADASRPGGGWWKPK